MIYVHISQISQISQLMHSNEGRLRRLKMTGGLTGMDADPWARCRGPHGGAAAGGRGLQLRNYIRRMQLEKSVEEGSVSEVWYVAHIYLDPHAFFFFARLLLRS